MWEGIRGAAAVYRYSPFGVEIPNAGGGGTGTWVNRLKYGAREYDAETGLYYNRARYYDPKLQRFLSPDPIGLAGGVNWYAYAGNDPVNYTDPTGLDTYCSRGQGQNWGNATVGGYDYTVTVGGPLTCTETPNFNPADEYYGQGFSYGTPAGAGSGGSGRAAPAAPPNHPIVGAPNSACESWGCQSGAATSVLAPYEIAGLAKATPAAIGTATALARPMAEDLLTTQAARRVFGSRSFLNHNRYLRIGFGRNGGNEVFRISGQWLRTPWAERLGIYNGHIDLIDLGPITRTPPGF